LAEHTGKVVLHSTPASCGVCFPVAATAASADTCGAARFGIMEKRFLFWYILVLVSFISNC
jgi:hypothetical protein